MKDTKKKIHYSNIFSKVSGKLRAKLLTDYQIEIETGAWLNSVVLKLYKRNWTDEISGSSIFFSIWLEDKGLIKNHIYYNIHALKLRQMTGYKIESRKFAAAFRERFKEFDNLFPNVSVNFGPLTLMQGWVEINNKDLVKDITDLVSAFLNIQHIIDELLEKWNK